MGRRPRAAAQAAAANLRTPTPHIPEISEDEEMIDPEPEVSVASSPPEDGTPGPGSEEPPSEANTPAPAPVIPRKRRLGRPPKIKPPGWDDPVSAAEDGNSERGTPKRRGRGRPPAAGGGRWNKNRGPSHVTQVPIDKAGNMMDVINDEVDLPEDPQGESKVDKMGYLQDGRDYRCRTFTILDRGERLYMLSTEPARCIGFRDSYLFFQKHKLLYKIIISDAEKYDLIERDLIPHSYKGRAIGVVTARSVFREFGARIIVGGRRVIDDYQEDKVRNEEGVVEGELADPADIVPKDKSEYNKNQYVAWHGASAVYHTGGPSVPLTGNGGKAGEARKRKVLLTDVNWMFEHAREASRFNSLLTSARRQNLDGIYEPHTNIMQYPKIMQPTHATWEELTPTSSSTTKPFSTNATTTADTAPPTTNGINGTSNLTNGISTSPTPPAESETEPPTLFPPVPGLYARNYLITDTYFLSPASSTLGLPQAPLSSHSSHAHAHQPLYPFLPAQYTTHDIAFQAENAPQLSEISSELLSELPEDCYQALVEARRAEIEWRGGDGVGSGVFGSEREKAGRGAGLRIGFN